MLKPSFNFAVGIKLKGVTVAVRQRWRILLSIDNSEKCFCQQKIAFSAAKNLSRPTPQVGGGYSQVVTF
jgi:hypothetical protein